MRANTDLVYAQTHRSRGDRTLRPRYLLVEDDPLLARALSRFLERTGSCTVVGTVREAMVHLEAGGTWTAFFFDVELPDGSGIDVLAHARAAYPSTPALVMTGSTARSAIIGAYEHRAEFVLKPVVPRHIERFLATCAESFDARLAVVVDVWTTRYALSEAQSDILLRAARGARREAIARARGTTDLTVKTQIRSLLVKTGDDDLQGAVERVLRESAGR
jgi:DNA-binding NarL/FixJ family response regulator